MKKGLAQWYGHRDWFCGQAERELKKRNPEAKVEYKKVDNKRTPTVNGEVAFRQGEKEPEV